jgi:penicillin-binding protein 1B
MAESTLKEILKRRSDDTIRRIQQRRSWAQRDKEGFPWSRFFLFLMLGLLVIFGVYAWSQSERAIKLVDAALADEPVQVYARALQLRPGVALSMDDLARELVRLGYRDEQEAGQPGTYRRDGSNLVLVTRPFRHADAETQSREVVIGFADGRVATLTASADGAALDDLRLDPMLIGSLLGKQGLAETVVLHGTDLSRAARDELLAIADPGTSLRSGVDYPALMRALVTGGDRSYTQQLVRSLNRDARGFMLGLDEALMAAGLEWRVPPERLFDAWLNHVHLGQDGGRAVRGVGVASYHWFGRQATELNLPQLALLGVLARDPTGLDPRKRPDQAQAARDDALAQAVVRQEISPPRAQEARAAPLGVTVEAPQGTSYHPAYMSLVRQHLLQEHGEGELVRPNLRAITALDPLLQERAERALADAVDNLETAYGLPPGTLEAAAVIAETRSGEVTALVGGRAGHRSARNRALDRVRPVGTLVQPAIWYAALMDGKKRFDWGTQVEDAALALRLPDGSAWNPTSSDGQHRGAVTLWEAAQQALEMPAVRVGMTLGVPEVLTTLQRFGFSRVVNANPTLLLGEVAMTPYEVAQQYGTLARGGERLQLTTLRFVGHSDGSKLARLGERRRERALDPRGAYLVQRALVESARRGTARMLTAKSELPAVAAQVGLTQGRRDGWVAGFDADHVLVVWVGRDDGEPTGFAGAAGALPVWGAMAKAVGIEPITAAPPGGVVTRHLDASSGAPTGAGCAGAVEVPFLADRAPAAATACSAGLRERAARALRDVVN